MVWFREEFHFLSCKFSPETKKSHEIQAFSNAQAFVAVLCNTVKVNLNRSSSPVWFFLLQVKEKVKLTHPENCSA
jgi:hypothetical protein